MAATASARSHEPLVIWAAQPGPQTALIACPVFEIFFGGARGGGKTDGVLGDFLEHGDAYGKDAIGLMLRRTRTELIETIERSRAIYTPLGWVYHEQDKMWRAPNGARLRFAYLERDADAEGYQGHSYTKLYIEEIGNFPSERPILKLMATLRSGAGVPVGFRATGNPGGPGHQWVKQRYIDPAPLGWRVILDPLTGLQRVYIPSRVSDNHYLDADYIQRLRASGSVELVKAWLEGDWSVIEGAFFDCWSNEKHVIRPFAIPEDWLRFRSMDWGSAKPFSVGWWAVVGDDTSTEISSGLGCVLPRGAIVRYREWYGSDGKPNTGLKLTAEQVANGDATLGLLGIKQREAGETISYGVLDPAAFSVDGGPSIAERMAVSTQGQIWFRRADNKRVGTLGALGGWDQMRRRLQGDGDGRPMLYVFSTCKDFIRTVPALQHDPARPEDVDCWVAGTMVSTPFGDRPIEEIKAGDLVDTPIGVRPVLRSYLSGSSGTAWVELSNGRRLEGTAHHKIYVQNKGLIALNDLKCYMILKERIIWSRSLNIAVWCIGVIKGGSTITQTVRSLRQAAQAYIAKCGLMQATLFPQGGTFTTATATTTITKSPISTACLVGNTHPCTFESVLPGSLGVNSRTGAAQMVAKLPSEKMQPRCGSERLNGNARANIVGMLLALDTLCKSFVLRRALLLCRTLLARFAGRRFGPNHIQPRKLGPVHIVAVGRSDVATQVYNLTVADAHLFYANGVLSSNTDGEDHAGDEARYACMSRPWIEETKTQKDIIAELIKPRSLDEMIAQYERETEN